MEKDNYTKIWRRYEKCKEYFDRKAIVKNTEENWNFYLGDQWKGCNTGGERLPVMNFIAPIIDYKVAIVSQNSMVANYSDIESRTEFHEIYEMLNQNFSRNWEKSKMDSVAWEIIRNAYIQGDSYAFWADGKTDVPPQILPNTSILFADENTRDIQSQKFILLRERMSVEEAKKIAEENKIDKYDIELIAEDNNSSSDDGVFLNTVEVKDKVTVITCLEKVDGVVNVTRSTKQTIIEPQRPLQGVDPLAKIRGEVRGAMSYPIVPMILEPQPFNARGVSEVRRYIPNQLEYNKTLARRAITVKLCAFPRIAYDSTAVENPEDLDTVGVPIEVNGGGAQSVSQNISYLNATNISSDADALCNDLLTITKDLAGASDAALGNVNPEQASGQAIIAVRDTAQIPINKNVARYKQFVEDVALLWFDMWVAYNPNGLQTIVEDDLGNQREMVIPQEQLQMLKPSVRIDVSQDNQWTKLSEQQLLDNLFEREQITLEEYVNLAPDNGTVPKGKMLAMLEKRKAEQEAQAQQGQQNVVYDILGQLGYQPDQIQNIVGQYLNQQQAQQPQQGVAQNVQ